MDTGEVSELLGALRLVTETVRTVETASSFNI